MPCNRGGGRLGDPRSARPQSRARDDRRSRNPAGGTGPAAASAAPAGRDAASRCPVNRSFASRQSGAPLRGHAAASAASRRRSARRRAAAKVPTREAPRARRLEQIGGGRGASLRATRIPDARKGEPVIRQSLIAAASEMIGIGTEPGPLRQQRADGAAGPRVCHRSDGTIGAVSRRVVRRMSARLDGRCGLTAQQRMVPFRDKASDRRLRPPCACREGVVPTHRRLAGLVGCALAAAPRRSRARRRLRRRLTKGQRSGSSGFHQRGRSERVGGLPAPTIREAWLMRGKASPRRRRRRSGRAIIK
jgi:hypothetical protein